MAHEIQFVPLSALATAFHPANPKNHSLPEIKASIVRHGFTEPPLIDDRTGLLVAGHGRVEALLELEQEGADVPRGLYHVERVGWMVPVTRGAFESPDDTAAKAYLVTSNRLTEKGGWIAQSLADVLSELAEADDGLVGTGYDAGDLDDLLASLTPPEPEEREPKAVTRYSVVVDVADTETQDALMDQLDREGYRCRALNS